jgi:hypothetical protein
MGYLEQLPEEVARMIEIQFVTEYASVSAAGVPIDTPLILCPSDDLTTLDVATGLAYPVKAERARRNPKVGLLLEAGPGQPVVSVAGLAAVRDADLQANMNRYLAEVLPVPIFSPSIIDYQSITRPAVWYFTRIIVQVTPVHIRWWRNSEAMDEPAQTWRAPADMRAPVSDPAPGGTPSEAPKWPQPAWGDLAREALDRGAAAHLTLLDAEGFPLPIRANAVDLGDDGFRLAMPKGAPWSGGTATLSFEGREIFVGQAAREGDDWRLRVERTLPVLPLTSDPSEVLQPTPDTKAKLMVRLEHETRRRGQPIPQMPAEPPEPTKGAKRRAAAALAYTETHPGSDGL